MSGEHQNPLAGSDSIVTVEKVTELKRSDLYDLCDATEAAIIDGGGFGWVSPPDREVMERYWKGVMAVPERTLIVGRLDGVIAGSAQLVRPTRNNEAQAFACNLTTSFVAPWARGHGMARRLTQAVIDEATRLDFGILNLDVRETQRAAITLYDHMGFTRWGTHPHYARAKGRTIAGHFYYKVLERPEEETEPQA
ncbi:GNAT family N-acetyltransferase [Niveispirillum sp.]|uniref:GNAT family N-acetyltransferase n=1 Tax=Niveispirillum sp. TaxID=1917217 RepID=UPI001B5320D3|nr:GNAT family N-acetyltransferase [Niveispirillum sp.]MBP7334693.1 GNAT family N-acetyltransferase [Niveispirillum sp.]